MTVELYQTIMKRDPDGSTQYKCIDLKNDVYFVEMEGRHLVFHVDGDKYYQINTLSDMEEVLIGAGFELTDKTNLVNMSKVKKYDEERRLLYFDEKPSEGSKYASVAALYMRLRGNDIKRQIAVNNNGAMEYRFVPNPFRNATESEFN